VLERCAQDWQELSDLFHRELRPDTSKLLDKYLENRIASGELAPVHDVSIAARFILETLTWFARTRLASQDTDHFDAKRVEDSIVELVCNAFLPEEKTQDTKPSRVT
jgi:hypothetical protein